MGEHICRPGRVVHPSFMEEVSVLGTLLDSILYTSSSGCSSAFFKIYFLKKQIGSVSLLSCVQLFATPWTVAHQVSLSTGFPREEYWSELLFPSLGDFPDPGIEPGFPTLQANSLPSEPPGKPYQMWRETSSAQSSHSVMSDSLRHHESQHTGLPVHHQLPESTQTHVHRVSDAIQPSHPLSSPSPPAPNPSQHQSLVQ